MEGLLILLILVMFLISFQLYRGRYKKPEPPQYGHDLKHRG